VKVIVYPADAFACGHYRAYWPAEVLARQGVDVKIVRPGEPTGISGLMIGGRLSASAPDCDVVVFQRPGRKLLADLVEPLRRMGVAVVVDVDDDLDRIHPQNPAFAAMHPKGDNGDNGYSWANVRRACKDATMVTVSTPSLLPRYAAHGRARLIYNYVPARMTLLEHDPAEDSLGWAGALHSHPGDLDQLGWAFARLQREGRTLKFVGPSEGLERKLGVTLGEGDCTGELPFGDWLPAVAKLGVGVAPLADTSFNASKSWLKPLEYSAVGVPWVASDTLEYRRLARECGAPLVSKPKQWYPELRRLLDDEPRRADLSAAVREAARGLTVEGHCHLWAEAWADAVKTERAAARP
jgi:glycosyltransferase involved in cell wall biosynthesis